MTFACELNFIPLRAPHEITDSIAGQALVDKINLELMGLELNRLPNMRAKLDPFHQDSDGDTISWSVEICPVNSFDTIWLDKDARTLVGEDGKPEASDWEIFKMTMDWLFERMRKGYGLVPSVKKRRGGTEIHQPGGGSHLHVSAALFGMNINFYSRMEQFHRNLAVSYANAPFVRWLFADWMSDRAHHTLWNPENGKPRLFDGETPEDRLFSVMINGDIHAIESRFMASGKGSFNTFEFRVFRMVENVEELRLIALFTEAWMMHLREKVYLGTPVKLTLTKRKWREFKDGRTVWARHIAPFLTELKLNPEDYRMFFTRNYLTRLKFGKME